MRCAAITKAQERCKAEATHGSYCWNHAPEMAEARKQRARKAGRAGGNGRPSGLSETAEAKRWIRDLVAKMIKGEVKPGRGHCRLYGVQRARPLHRARAEDRRAGDDPGTPRSAGGRAGGGLWDGGVVGSVRRRLERIEERRAAKLRPRRRSEAERYKDWQARASIRRDQETPRSAKVTRSRIAWLRRVGKLGEFASAEHLIVDDIMAGPDGSGGLQPPEERSRTLVEHEVYSSVKRRDSGFKDTTGTAPVGRSPRGIGKAPGKGFSPCCPSTSLSTSYRDRAMQERGEPEAALEDHAEH